MSGNGIAPIFRLLLAGVFLWGLSAPARGGVAPKGTEPEVTEFRRGEDIFRMRFKEDELDPDKYKGPLALCQVCGRPLVDHLDPNFVCRDPRHRMASLQRRPCACPVCGHRFSGPLPETGSKGGIDRDFCRHPIGVYIGSSDVWLCPKCGYAALFWEFNRPVPDEVKSYVAEQVTKRTVDFFREFIRLKPTKFQFDDFTFLSQDLVPESLKYANALKIYARRKASPRLMAKLHLGSSHAYRRIICGPFAEAGLDRAIRKIGALLADPELRDEGPEGAARLGRELLSRSEAAMMSTREAGPPRRASDADPSDKLGVRDRLCLLLRLAGLHDRLGEGWLSKKYLEEAEAVARSEKEEEMRAAYVNLARRHVVFLHREVVHQAEAARFSKQALASGEVPPEERLTTIYLVGELLARLGDVPRAVPWLEATIRLSENPAAGPEARRKRLRSWAEKRLSSPAFLEETGEGEFETISADPSERAELGRILKQLVDATSEGPAGAAPAAPAAPAATERPAAPVREPEAPASCREQLERIWRALAAYKEKRGDFPPTIEALVKGDLITPREAGDFVCVESAHKLFYRKPPPGSGRTFVVFHANPRTCFCKNLLYSDGAIEELGKKSE